MENKMFGLLLTLTVGIIMIGALVAPIVASYGYETAPYVNEGVPYASYDDEEHTIVVSMDSSSELSITTDGETDELPDFTLYGAATIVYADDGLVRLSSAGYLRAFDSTGMVASVNLTAGDSATITVSETGVTVVSDDNSYTATFTPTAYIASEGDYVLSDSPHVSDESVIIAGVTDYSADYIVFSATGTIDDIDAAIIYAYIDSAAATATSVSATANTTAANDNGLYEISSVVITAVIDATEYTGTYTYFLVPLVVEYDNPNYIGFGVAGIMAALVVVCILSLVVMAAKGMENRTL